MPAGRGVSRSSCRCSRSGVARWVVVRAAPPPSQRQCQQNNSQDELGGRQPRLLWRAGPTSGASVEGDEPDGEQRCRGDRPADEEPDCIEPGPIRPQQQQEDDRAQRIQRRQQPQRTDGDQHVRSHRPPDGRYSTVIEAVSPTGASSLSSAPVEPGGEAAAPVSSTIPDSAARKPTMADTVGPRRVPASHRTA